MIRSKLQKEQKTITLKAIVEIKKQGVEVRENSK